MVIFLIAAVLVAFLWMKRKAFASVMQSYQRKMGAIPKKKMVLTATATSAVNTPSVPIKFNLDKALEAVTQEEKKYLKPALVTRALEKEDPENGAKKITASLEDAEIYIAYERYAQAEKVLQQILAQQPNHWNALLKLLELYVLTEKYQEFEQLFATVPNDLKELSPNTWSKIELLLEKVQNEKIVPIAKTNVQATDLKKVASSSVSSTSSPKKLSGMVPKFTLEKIDPEIKSPTSSEKMQLKSATEAENLQPRSPEKFKDTSKEDFSSQLSLAQASLEMGDFEGAKTLLDQLNVNCSPAQKEQVQLLLDRLPKT